MSIISPKVDFKNGEHDYKDILAQNIRNQAVVMAAEQEAPKGLSNELVTASLFKPFGTNFPEETKEWFNHDIKGSYAHNLQFWRV